MRRVVSGLLLVFFATLSSVAQEINWVTLEEAVALQNKKPKKIMLDVYTSWCGPCKLLDKNTFKNKDVTNYVNKHYYAVKFNAEGNSVVNYKDKTFSNPKYDSKFSNSRNSVHELAEYFKIKAYPTIVFLDEKGELIFPLQGYKKPTELELFLKMFNENKHLELDTQDKFYKYYKAFVPKFKE